MSDTDLNKLYELATDPNSNQEVLREVWNTTKSTRIRKAVVSNANCDSETMRMGARLYIKEVMTNPSFELLKIFNEDQFVKTLSDAYGDPQAFSRQRTLSSIKNTGGDRTNLLRAMLISPNLTSPKALGEIAGLLTAAEFNRELKEEGVKKNVVRIVKGNLRHFYINSLIFFYNNGIIDAVDMSSALDSSNDNSRYTLSKGEYVGFVSRAIGESIKGSVFHYELALKFILHCSSRNIKDLIKAFKKGGVKFNSLSHLEVLGSLYRDLLYHDMVRCNAIVLKDKLTNSWYSRGSIKPDSYTHSYQVSKLIWEIIGSRNVWGVSLDNIDLKSLYEDVKVAGMSKDVGAHPPDIKLDKLNVLSGMNHVCAKLVDLEDDEAFTFFLTSGVLWEDWYCKGEVNNPEFKAVERINRINGERFARGEKLLYSCTEIDVYPTLQICQNLTGKDYLYVAKSTPKVIPVPLPAPSGKVSPSVMGDWVKKEFASSVNAEVFKSIFTDMLGI